MLKAFQVFQWTEKKFSRFFLFTFVPQLILNFLLFHVIKLIASKFKQYVQFLNLSILAEIVCVLFIYFDDIIGQRLRKSSSWLNFFLNPANEIKTCGLVQLPILGMPRDLVLQSRDFQSLNEDSP